MRHTNLFKICLLGIAALTTLFLATPRDAAAHCDTLDGPVIQDARKAIENKDITPVLKWVKPKDEKAVRAAFQKVLAGKGKSAEAAEHAFFTTLVKIHRHGEGAPGRGPVALLPRAALRRSRLHGPGRPLPRERLLHGLVAVQFQVAINIRRALAKALRDHLDFIGMGNQRCHLKFQNFRI